MLQIASTMWILKQTEETWYKNSYMVIKELTLSSSSTEVFAAHLLPFKHESQQA